MVMSLFVAQQGISWPCL